MYASRPFARRHLCSGLSLERRGGPTGLFLALVRHERDSSIATFFNAVVAAARQVGLPVISHTHRHTLDEVLVLGSTGGSAEHLSAVFWDHLDKSRLAEMPLSKIQSIATALRQAGVWITPTLKCQQDKTSNPAHDRVMEQIVKTLQDVGVGMFLAADDGLSVHDELAALVGAGLSPYQALVTGTRNPAAFYKLSDSVGTVGVGKWADLVLLSGNPLEDVQHAREPVGVMLAGRWFDRAALDQFRRTPLTLTTDAAELRLAPVIAGLAIHSKQAAGRSY